MPPPDSERLDEIERVLTTFFERLLEGSALDGPLPPEIWVWLKKHKAK